MPSPRLAVGLSAALLSSLLLAPGCIFYTSDDDDCLYGGEGTPDGDRAEAYDPGVRNPETGVCEYYGGGGGGGGSCDSCGNCPPTSDTDPGAGAEAPTPTWGACESDCTGRDEFTCLSTAACRAIYTNGTFADCWATDTTGPVQGGGCEALDAYGCSIHDDCSAVHTTDCAAGGGEGDAPVPECGTIGAFSSCVAERVGCYGTEECPDGQTCNAADICLSPPGCGEGDGLSECPAVCYGYCVGGSDPIVGSCEGEVTCEETPPGCPPGSTAGIAEGCYTGYCIPLEDCEGALACGDITDEESCVERTDCTPNYEGVDCVCPTPDTCDCAEWNFTFCSE